VIRRWVLRHRRLSIVARRVLDVGRGFRARLPTAAAGAGTYPTSYRVTPAPSAIATDWPEPPVIDNPIRAEVVHEEPVPPMSYDLALFEALNAEYAAKPVAPRAPKYDTASLADRSRQRIAVVHDHLDLRDRTVLEVGCGAGYEVWYLAHQLGCDAWGIDISPRVGWSALRDDRVHLIEGDIATRGSLPENTFDRVVSFTVWEHVTRPIEAITELNRVMKPGGLAWVRANLYRGPTASHRTRDIKFPFPHLLFGDDVIAEGLRRARRPALGAAWVNRLTWEQYENAFLAAGFTIRALSFTTYPLDEAFYARFEDILGRYPKVDLERGFFQVVLEKTAAR
jgi:SAM-dependent methyltransferase